MAKLIRRHKLNFQLEDFFGIYFVGQNTLSRKCYLSCRPKKNPLILELPDKDDLKDVLIIGGNWEFGPGERDRTMSLRQRAKPVVSTSSSLILLHYHQLSLLIIY